jgi:hypothetical protein
MFIHLLGIFFLITQVSINPLGKTIEERFPAPTGFYRQDAPKNAFATYLRQLPLKAHGSFVKSYQGKILDKKEVYLAVIEMDLDARDLQQCADAVMRLKGEYLFQQGKKKQISFRLVATNQELSFLSHTQGDQSYAAFRKYMRYIFTYANTTSLRNQLIPVELSKLKIGDVFIQKAQNGRAHGHAVIVVDLVVNPNGQKRYLLAQSYMPAQDTQILINRQRPDISPWYELDIQAQKINTPEWDFVPSDLRRFKDDF